MRLRHPDTLQTLALYALPVVVAWLNFHVPGALAATILVLLAGMVSRSRRLFAPSDQIPELHTITYSHYVEKVRWCLDRAGIAYREMPSIGIVGILLTGRTVPALVLPWARTSIGDSPEILRFLWGRYSAPLGDRVRFLAPTVEAIALEKKLDLELGIEVRRWSYWHLLENRELTLEVWGINEPDIPEWQRRLLPLVEPPLAWLLRRMLDITDATAAAGLVSTKKVFDDVGAMLADGRRHLLGDELSFVDITFASLAALALFPDSYGGGAIKRWRPPLERLTPGWRGEVEALRATRAGQYALRLYEEERVRRRELETPPLH